MVTMMDNLYRLFLKSASHPESVLEWQFTKRDLDFIHHQYAQGVIDKQSGKVLPLVLGKLVEHQAEELHAMFTDNVSLEALGRAFHGDQGGIPDAFACLRSRPIPSEKSLTVTSIEDGDLMFRLQTLKHGVWNEEGQSVKVPFSLIEDVHGMFETNHPGLQGEWHRIKVYPMLMTPKLEPLQTYDVTLSTSVTLEGQVRIQARSADVAAQKAVNAKQSVSFHQVGTSPVTVENLNRIVGSSR